MKSLLGDLQMNELLVLNQGDVLAEVQGQVGLITLNRAKALKLPFGAASLPWSHSAYCCLCSKVASC
jgi:hypothetical protein